MVESFDERSRLVVEDRSFDEEEEDRRIDVRIFKN